MKKIILAIGIFLIYQKLSASTLTFSGDHDSLIFDGSNKSSSINILSDDRCTYHVFNVSGDVRGTVMWDTTEYICGEKEKYTVYRKQRPHEFDLLKPGDTVFTGADGKIRIDFTYYDVGKEYNVNNYAVLGPNSMLILPPCQSLPIDSKLKLIKGKVYRKIPPKARKEIDNGVETIKSFIKDKLTEFSVEVTEDNDIVKVYEGSVDVTIKKVKDDELTDASFKMTQLTEDFKNGKISKEEFMEKSKELMEIINKGRKNLNTNITVDAGYQCTIGDKLGEPAPIGSDDDRWFEK